MIKKIILLLIGSVIIHTSYSFFLDLKTYKNYSQVFEKKYGKRVNTAGLEKINKFLKGEKCIYFYDDSFYYLLPSCLYDNKLPKLNFKEAVDKSWPYIENFSQIYDLNSKNFFYTAGDANYSIDLKNYLGKTNPILSYVLQKKKIYIKIPTYLLAINQTKNYSFYVADKNLSKRNKSRLQNFYVAINKLDNYMIKSGQTLYFNKLIAYAPGYTGKGKYMFYGGVCGVSTLLFRNALVNPLLYVKERTNHRKRYVYFYSPYIYGDDASIYELDKRLKITNNSHYDIYFKKKQIGNKIYLVSIVPKKITDFAFIEKKQIGRLKAFLSSTTFDIYGNPKYKQSWISKYDRKSYER